MPKNYGKCALCTSKKFLNYAGLCKRCNQSEESTKIVEAAMKVQKEKNAAKKLREEQLAKQNAVMEAQAKEAAAEGEGEESEGEEQEEGAEDKDTKEK